MFCLICCWFYKAIIVKFVYFSFHLIPPVIYKFMKHQSSYLNALYIFMMHLSSYLNALFLCGERFLKMSWSGSIWRPLLRWSLNLLYFIIFIQRFNIWCIHAGMSQTFLAIFQRKFVFFCSWWTLKPSVFSNAKHCVSCYCTAIFIL